MPLDTSAAIAGVEPDHARVVVESPTVTPAQMAESIGVSRATIERRILNGAGSTATASLWSRSSGSGTPMCGRWRGT
ncbi:MAG: hypothetical protein LBS56_01660 [Propionibacteriaceae bacterium]|jgi:hypothetical protein|nr:hypothetical protein [Propionibacteriaceae bacterium]